MALGGLFGAAGMTLPFVETVAALSVLVFGAVIPSQMTPTLGATTALVGVFAIFHGFAHGSEMPVNGSAIDFAIGFMAATALLRGLGIALGLAVRRSTEASGRYAMQACGVACGSTTRSSK